MDPLIVRYSERPELWADRGDLFDDVWPEYNEHGDELSLYWQQLYDVFPEWQFMLVDPADATMLAEGHPVPLAWDCRPGTYPVIPRSLHIGGSVADWESWTKMAFPESGDYVFPAGLATVHIDREQGTGDYWEPNVWIIHQVS